MFLPAIPPLLTSLSGDLSDTLDRKAFSPDVQLRTIRRVRARRRWRLSESVARDCRLRF